MCADDRARQARRSAASAVPGGDADPGEDGGLLAPVRAGRAVEAATGDRAWLRAMLDAEVALTAAAARGGLAPSSAAEAVRAAADEAGFDVRALARAARAGGGNPVIPLVGALTSAVAERDAAAAAYVHRGATSQDVMDTAAMLVARRACEIIEADLRRLAVALAALARRHRDTVAVGRTLTQHAVPTTFGLRAAGWLAQVADASARLRRAAEALPAQLGGAAGTLAAFGAYQEAQPPADGRDRPRDAGPTPQRVAGTAPTPGPDEDPSTRSLRLVAYFAAELGLVEPLLPWHAARTPVADLGAALALTGGALGKFAADVLVLGRTEIGEVAEGAGGGSSAMPHKRNPVLATLVAAAARRLPAHAAVLAASMVAADERPAGAWHAEWQPLREALREAGGAAAAAADLAEGLVVFPARMRANLDLTGGLVVAERLSAVLAARLGRPAARDLLDRVSEHCHATGRPLRALLAEAPELAGLDLDLDDLCDPARYTGAAGPLVDRVLDRHRAWYAPSAEDT